uniref:Uncharacterized protein n=1 Tax=Chenopodium quinoa TaxID=63459 RepID=A0A803M8B3_CHEQI
MVFERHKSRSEQHKTSDSSSMATSSELRNTESHSQDHGADKIYASNFSFGQKVLRSEPEVHTTGSGMVKATDYQTADEIATVKSLLELPQQPPKRSCTEAHLTKIKDGAKDWNPIISGNFAQTDFTVRGHLALDVSKQVGLSFDKPTPVINQQVAASSSPVETFIVSMK